MIFAATLVVGTLSALAFWHLGLIAGWLALGLGVALVAWIEHKRGRLMMDDHFDDDGFYDRDR